MYRVTGLLLISVVSLSGILNSACGAKILSVTFFSSKSHKLTYMPLLEELGKRGHNVTILTTVEPTKTMRNVKEIMLLDTEAHAKEFMENNGINHFEMKKAGKNPSPFAMLDWFTDLCSKSYDLPQVQSILKEEFDLIFFQPIFNDCALGLVHRLKAPVILFSPVGMANFLVEKVGGHFPPSFVPSVFLGFKEDMNFYQRFLNFGSEVLTSAILRFYYEPAMEAIYRDKLGQDIPSVREILGNTSLVLSNGHFSLHRPKPLFPDVVEVGGIHSRPAKPLPKELEDFVGGAKDGLIYFSMGSAIRESTMPDEKRQLFLNVFAKLKQRVLWKWETGTMANLSSNVKLSKWVPQQDVLGHKHTRMFITHCGGGSTEEAIYHRVPLVGLPMFGDQPLNAKLAQDHGFIIELDWNELTEDKLFSAIQEILKNSSYRDNVKRLSSIYRDQPDKPMDRAVYWVEYVLRHKGAVHLRSVGRNLNFIQYHSYDVLLAYRVIIGVILYLVFIILRFILRKVFCRSSKKTVPSKKSKKE